MKKIISMLLVVTLVVTTMMGGMLDVFAEEAYYEVPKDNFWGKINFSNTNNNNVQSLFDGTLTNYWYFDMWQDNEQWIAIDLGEGIVLNAIKLDAPADSSGNPITRNGATLAIPEEYDLYYATESAGYDALKGATWVNGSDGIATDTPDLSAGSTWTKLGSYTSADEMAKFDATRCRYLLINTTKTTKTKLSIGEFHAYSPYQDVVKTVDYEQEEGFITDKASWGLKAWTSPDGSTDNKADMVDGDVSTTYSLGANEGVNLPYVIVDMGTEVSLNRVAMKWKYPNKNYMPDKVSVYTSYDKVAYDAGKDSSAWTVVADNVNVNASYIDVSFNARPARYFMIKTTELGNEFKGCTKTWIGFGEIYAYEDVSNQNAYYEVPKDNFWGKINFSNTNNNNVQSLFDGTLTNYWYFDMWQDNEQWIAIDLGEGIVLNAIKLDAPADSSGNPITRNGATLAIPEEYDLYYATESAGYDALKGATWVNGSDGIATDTPDLSAGSTWTKLGSYTSADEMAKFDATRCRYLLINTTKTTKTKLSIGEFHAYSPYQDVVKTVDYEQEEGFITDKASWGLKAWTSPDGSTDNKADMVDGDVSTTYSLGANEGVNLPYVIVDMGTEVSLNRVAMKWKYPNKNYMPDKVSVYTSYDKVAYDAGKDSSAWTVVADNVNVNASYIDVSFNARPARYFMIKTTELGNEFKGCTKTWIGFGEIYAYEDVSDLNLYYEIPNCYFWAKASGSFNSSLNVHSLFDGRLGYMKNGAHRGFWTYWVGGGKYQNTNQWLAVDLGNVHKLNGIYLEDSGYSDEFNTPTAYNLYVSDDGTDYESLVGESDKHTGNQGLAAVAPTISEWTLVGNFTSEANGSLAKFNEIQARYVLIVPSESASTFFSIEEFHAYSSEEVIYDFETDALDSSTWMEKSWVNTTPTALASIREGGTSESNKPYIMVDMGENTIINRVVMKGTPSKWYTPDKVNVYTAVSDEAYASKSSDAWTLVAENVEFKGGVMDAKFMPKNARYFMIDTSELGVHSGGTAKDWGILRQIYAYEGEIGSNTVELTAEYDADENALNIASNVDLNIFAISADDITITDANGDVPYVKDIVITDAGISMSFPFGLAVSGTYTVHIGVIDKDVEFTAEADANALYNVALTDGNGNLVKNIDNISKLKIDFDAKTTGSVQMFMAAYSGNIMQRAVRVAAEEGGAAIDVEPNTDYVKIFVWDANLAPVFEPITVGHGEH